MKSITTERLSGLLAAGALIGWSLHFYTQFEKPGIGWFEAAFGGWSMLPLSIVFSLWRLNARTRAKTFADEPHGFYEQGAARYFLVVGVAAGCVGLIWLGARPYLR